jgi:hypothetical protein
MGVLVPSYKIIDGCDIKIECKVEGLSVGKKKVEKMIDK